MDSDGNIAVVPVKLMENIVNDAKVLLEKSNGQEKTIRELKSIVDNQKERIHQLEAVCRDRKAPSDNETAIHEPVKPIARKKMSIRRPSVATRRGRSSISSNRRGSAVDMTSFQADDGIHDQIAQAIQSVEFDQLKKKARDYNKLLQKNEEYAKIVRATRQISAQKRLDGAIDCILVSACSLLECKAMAVCIVDYRGRKVQITSAIRSPNPDQQSTILASEASLSYTRSIIGHVIETKEECNIDSVDSCSYFDPSIDDPCCIGIDSVLCYPIISDDGHTVIAVLQAINKKPDTLDDDIEAAMQTSTEFTSEDDATIRNIAEAVGGALSIVSLNDDAKQAQKRVSGLLHLLQEVTGGSSSYAVIEKILRLSSKEILEAERVSYFTLTPDRKFLCINHSQDVEGIRIPAGQGIVGHAASKGEDVLVADAYTDSRFDKSVDKKTGFVTRSVMCMPVYRGYGCTTQDDIIGVIEAVNKVNGPCFEPTDLELLRHIARSAGISMHRTMLHEQIVQSKNFTESRMRITNIVAHHAFIDEVIRVISESARLFIDVGETTLYFVDHNLSQVWTLNPEAKLVKAPIGKGFAGYAALTEQNVHVNDARDDPLFDPNYETPSQSVLCIPIFDATDHVIAVFKATNREMASRVVPFNDDDVEILESFCKDVAMALEHLSFEILCIKVLGDSCDEAESEVGTLKASLLAEFTDKRLENMLSVRRPSTNAARSILLPVTEQHSPDIAAIASWDVDILILSHREIYSFVEFVFARYQFLDEFNISILLLQNFLETVRLKHRDNPFHNFHHGFHCFHALHMLLQTSSCSTTFQKLEVIGGLTAALCHDIDHPGHSNAFEVNSRSALTILHNDDAVLERHHARTTFNVLQQKNSNIFHALSPRNFAQVRKIIISAILATDMRQHFNQLKQLEAICAGKFDKSKASTRHFLLDTFVHACGTAAQVQPLKCAQKWHERLIEEYQSQVIKEEKLNLKSCAFMKPLHKSLAQAQFHFTYGVYILLPYWKTIAKLIPETGCCVTNLQANIEYYRNQVCDYTD